MSPLFRTAVFRADASYDMGTGHVMRCLTLADALVKQGTTCHFVCREHPGHLLDYIANRGFSAHSMSLRTQTDIIANATNAYAPWLGATQQQDAGEFVDLLNSIQPVLTIVDHYAIDVSWEKRVQRHDCVMMVIDDLADREHCCDLLLDQNLGRTEQDYVGLVSEHCELLLGPTFALLRNEFSQWRHQSVTRRLQPQLKSILVTLGGTDPSNATAAILKALAKCNLPRDINIVVVMGATAPWLADIKRLAAQMPWRSDVLVNVTNMAELMTQADLAIGAAGSTSWERCCLGLPTLITVLAENQREIAYALIEAGAALSIGDPAKSHFESELISKVNTMAASTSLLSSMSMLAQRVTDGEGTQRVLQHLNQAKRV